MYVLSYTAEGKLIAYPIADTKNILRQMDNTQMQNILSIINMPKRTHMMIESVVRASRSAGDFRSWRRPTQVKSPRWIMEGGHLIRKSTIVTNRSNHRDRWGYVYKFMGVEGQRDVILHTLPPNRWDFLYCPKTQYEPAVCLYNPYGRLTLRYTEGQPLAPFDAFGMYANNQD